MSKKSSSESLVIETAGAALFVEEVARHFGQTTLEVHAGSAALHLQGIESPDHGYRSDASRLLEGGDSVAAQDVLQTMAQQGGPLAAAAEAVLVELTDPRLFWEEIHQAKALSRAAGVSVPDTIYGVQEDLYGTGPRSAVDLPKASESVLVK